MLREGVVQAGDLGEGFFGLGEEGVYFGGVAGARGEGAAFGGALGAGVCAGGDGFGDGLGHGRWFCGGSLGVLRRVGVRL